MVLQIEVLKFYSHSVEALLPITYITGCEAQQNAVVCD